MSIKEIQELIGLEEQRQKSTLSLIASENWSSNDVRNAQGSRLTDKYAEGYPNKRYYNGCEYVDLIEQKAIDAACAVFKSNFANVQPHSGSQANQAIFLGFLQPGDTILAMDLHHGGHLTHGSKVNFSGKTYNAKHYGTNSDGIIDMNEVADLAKMYNPKLIIAGASAYSRHIDWEGFRQIANSVNAYFLADIAHFSGLIAAECYPSPIPVAHFSTSSTHKVLRGPRGGLILSNDPAIAKKIDSAVFPGTQGGPMMHTIAAKAICFFEALDPSYKEYGKQVINNARALCKGLQELGWKVVSGGTDCHMFTLDLTSKMPELSGKDGANLLREYGLVVNIESIPNDKRSVRETSGIRLGTPSATSRGLKEDDMQILACHIDSILTGSEADSHLVKDLLPN